MSSDPERRNGAFRKAVLSYYRRHGRQSLPWRHTEDPYRILISEVMLQQTQVDRVVPKYESFLKRFPTVQKLAEAPLLEVLRQWQGLGYNRRARNLHQSAKVIVREYRGRMPRSYAELLQLPGVGPYTAGAVMTFAYNEAVPMIETNIRSVYLHHFFKDSTDVRDTELLRHIEETLDRKNPRRWNWALMDYGAFIKKEFGNPNGRSKHHTQQSAFRGSDREIRGAILRALLKGGAARTKLHAALAFEDIRIDAQLEKLVREGMIVRKGKQFFLPE